MRSRSVSQSGSKHVRAKLIVGLLLVGVLWLVIAKPVESAAAVGHVVSSLSTFVASFR